MKILLAPDSFKGCLTSRQVCDAINEGIKSFSKKIDVMQFPSSDGGEGFCDCMREIFGGDIYEREVTYPLGNIGNASFLYNQETKTACIELASASGLTLVHENERNIMDSSTLGTGELIREAIILGAKCIVIGLGGSATNDCGMGILHALGMRFLDSAGFELNPKAASLSRVAYIVKNEMIDISGINFIAACDVKNPLCGENGAAEVFSRQKGATDEQVKWLDNSAHSFARVLGIDPGKPGSGDAGGVGAAVLSVLGGEYVSGASLLADSVKFTNALKSADLLITGEGNTDYQTSFGKLVSVVLSAAKKNNVKALVLSGGLSKGYEVLYEQGACGFYSLMEDVFDLDYCIANAYDLLKEKSKDIMKKIKAPI